MNRQITIALVAGMLVLGLLVQASPERGHAQDAATAASPDAARPGKEHDRLRTFAGVWDDAVTFWPAPGVEPIRSRGRSVNTMILGGRYLQTEARGTKEDGFEGRGVLGYDRVRGRYVWSWIDAMGTGISLARGTSKDGGKTIELLSDDIDPRTKKPVTYRIVLEEVSTDRHRFLMYVKGATPEFKTLEVVYTRRR